MPHYQLMEGEGIAGPLHAVTAETTSLYSCMGVVMFNQATNTAGLYHYGANSIGDVFTRNTIIQMINDIDPTDVFVTAPPLVGVASMGQGSTPEDRNALDLFLMGAAVAALVQWMPDRVFSDYGRVRGVFRVNVVHGVGGGSRRVIEIATQMPRAAGRQIRANISFYGGKKPNARRFNRTVDDSVL